MGALAPRCAHATPSAQPPIDTSQKFSAQACVEGAKKLREKIPINFLAISDNFKHFSLFSKKNTKESIHWGQAGPNF